MPKYKLLALDLDGTLTDNRKCVSAKNKEYISKARGKGVEIILASGRPVIGILPVAGELDMWTEGGYIMAYNGGQIIDCRTHRDLVKRTVPMEFVHDICDVRNHFDVFPLTYNETGVICENDTDIFVKREAFNNSIPIIKVSDLEKEITEPKVKFMVVGDPVELQKAYEYLKGKFEDKLSIFFSEPFFLEITPSGIGKDSALRELENILKVTSAQLMVCGDGLNDIPMLECAGLAVAMDNAYDEVKKIADHITSSNEDDGVAEAIRRFILEED